MRGPIRQFPLGLASDVPPSFANFVPGSNREAVAIVRAVAARRGERYAYLSGPVAAGKTHLLIAAARAADGFFLDAGELGVGPGVIGNLDRARLVCLDRVSRVAGDRGWEQALFEFFNALEGTGTPLLVADRAPPARLGLVLPDLASRLASGPRLSLIGLGEADLVRVLEARARARGWELAPPVAAYLMSRERRELGHLLRVLDRLDRQSLAARRRVTVPFVRSVLARAPSSGDARADELHRAVEGD